MDFSGLGVVEGSKAKRVLQVACCFQEECEMGKLSEEEIKQAHVGEVPELNNTVLLEEYNREWPAQFEILSAIIKKALSHLEISLNHVGSTSVPGLAAKPIIDMVLEVPDSTDESSYVSHLVDVGFELWIREPDWFEHRLLKYENPSTNLHVFTKGCSEVSKMIRFRDHLRTSPSDFELYLATKRKLAAKKWKYTQNYADAKSEVVQDITGRIGRGKN